MRTLTIVESVIAANRTLPAVPSASSEESLEESFPRSRIIVKAIGKEQGQVYQT